MGTFIKYFKLVTLLATLLVASCSQITEREESVLDEEFGLIETKADSASIRDGSEEAKAVLGMANKILTTEQDANDFFSYLDTQMHRFAAENIVEYRKGADGVIGTEDDSQFLDLAVLDHVPYVGRTAMMGLFILAKESGLFNPDLECGNVMGNKDPTVLNTNAHFIELENSKCTYFSGSVSIDLARNVSSKYYSLRFFDNIVRVEGSLKLVGLRGTTENLRALKEVGSLIMIGLNKYRPLKISTTLTFPVLTKADTIDLLASNIPEQPWGGMFNSLVEVKSLNIYSHTKNDAFIGLQNLQSISTLISNIQIPVLENITTAYKIDVAASYPIFPFPNLITVTTLSMLGIASNSSFSNLETAGTLIINASASTFEKLESVDSLDLHFTTSSWTGMNNLRSVEHISLVSAHQESHGLTQVIACKGLTVNLGTVSNSLLENLELIDGNLFYKLYGSNKITGLNKLEIVEKNFKLDISKPLLSFDGLEALDSIGGDIRLVIKGQNRIPDVIEDFLNQIERFSGKLFFNEG